VRHREAVFRYLRARCDGEDQALELAAVTFERAFVALPSYRTRGGGFLAWLFRIARNAAIDEQRRRRRTALAVDINAPVEPSLEEQVIAGEERAKLRRLVAELPDPQRDAVALRYGGGLTAREIGLVIGKSEEATQKLISRAVGRLREEFK
jgi:RNA polymerase sigma-70 factor (ECF subfamily)